MAAAGNSFGRDALSTGNAKAAVGSSGKQCVGPTPYGSQCIDARGSGLTVTQIQTWFDDTGMFWPNHRWRIDLERYACNPLGKTKSACWASVVWHGKTRAGDVPRPRNTALPAHFGNRYWPTFTLPHRFNSNGWLCTEVSVFNSAAGRWVYNGAGLSHGLRACVSVHG